MKVDAEKNSEAINFRAFIHRDYSIVGGAVSLAIFDDRVEVWSAGEYPRGITPDALSRRHLSVQRNPMIADMFHRTGLIEKWGRGTNRVIDMCREAGISPPEFEEITGAAVVTFRVSVGLTEQVTGQVLLFCRIPRKAAEIQNLLHLKHRENFVENYLKPLLDQGWLERTIPDKPRSRLQRYRTTSAGEEVFKKQGVK